MRFQHETRFHRHDSMLLDTLVAQAESIGVEFGCTMDLHFYSMADQHSNIMDAPPP